MPAPLAAFSRLKDRWDAYRPSSEWPLCKVGAYEGCFVLKLQKAAWTNDPMTEVPNQTGIFFSVWVFADGARANKVHYSIHALKLRKLKAYALASREFAAAFRNDRLLTGEAWPNLSVDYGPANLMEGWLPMNPDTFETEVWDLLERFESLWPLLDRLLAERRVPQRDRRSS